MDLRDKALTWLVENREQLAEKLKGTYLEGQLESLVNEDVFANDVTVQMIKRNTRQSHAYVLAVESEFIPPVIIRSYVERALKYYTKYDTQKAFEGIRNLPRFSVTSISASDVWDVEPVMEAVKLVKKIRAGMAPMYNQVED